jgi:hypothetical protein
MVFKTPNRKRKTLKRNKSNTKRRFINRKSKKYGGRFINPDVESIIKNLQDFIAKQPPANRIIEPNEVYVILATPYEFDGEDLLNKFKNAKKSKKDKDEQASAIYDVYREEWEKAKSEYNRKQSAQQPTSPTENTIVGCPSHNKEPIMCKSRNDYLKQSLIFHPDKNVNCKDEATEKFKKLIAEDVCGPFSQ